MGKEELKSLMENIPDSYDDFCQLYCSMDGKGR